MTTPAPTRPLPFHVQNNCYKYENKYDKPFKVVKALIEEGKTGPGKWGKKAYFYNDLVIGENRWGDEQRLFTPIGCNDPTPEGYQIKYQKKYLAGGRRKNKSRRNKRKNRKTRRH